jgi:hypothetical protein
VDWMARARVGDEPAIRSSLDIAASNPALRDAFVELVGDLFKSRSPSVVIPAVEAVAYLRCKSCEKALLEIVSEPLLDGGDPVVDLYGYVGGTEVRQASMTIARVAIGGLAFQGTKSSRHALLEQIAGHPDHDVRVMAIRALRTTYGSTLDADIAAIVLPTELDELSRPL